jgi:aspartate-semialdehyde dehydrogenase
VKKEHYNVAVVGATGAVGEQMREVLEGASFPSAGKSAGLGAFRRAVSAVSGRQLCVGVLKEDSFKGMDIGSPPAAASAVCAFTVAAGAVVVDNTAFSHGWTCRWSFPK